MQRLTHFKNEIAGIIKGGTIDFDNDGIIRINYTSSETEQSLEDVRALKSAGFKVTWSGKKFKTIEVKLTQSRVERGFGVWYVKGENAWATV